VLPTIACMNHGFVPGAVTEEWKKRGGGGRERERKEGKDAAAYQKTG